MILENTLIWNVCHIVVQVSRNWLPYPRLRSGNILEHIQLKSNCFQEREGSDQFNFFVLETSSLFENRVVQRCTWAVISWQLDNVAPKRDTLKHPPVLRTQYLQEIARVFFPLEEYP